MRTKFTAILLLTAMLLAATLTPVMADPLPPAYYLPTEPEMLSGFVLTDASGPYFNQPGTAYQEIRTYQRAVPFATIKAAAGISSSTMAAHARLGALVGNFAAGAFMTMPSGQGDESTMLWKVGPPADSYMLLWRTGSLVGTVAFGCPTDSTSPRDAGYQMGLIARPMLDRMQAHPDGV